MAEVEKKPRASRAKKPMVETAKPPPTTGAERAHLRLIEKMKANAVVYANLPPRADSRQVVRRIERQTAKKIAAGQRRAARINKNQEKRAA